MRRIAIVGAGHRCYMNFAYEIAKNYSDFHKIVAVCDVNIGRCEFFSDKLDKEIKVYTDFDKMLSEQKPDAVIVTTPDCYHHEYVIRALDFGCDVYSEKPLTIDAEKCLAIREAEKRNGKRVTVTFNCRFMPYFARLKEIISSGEIGRPLAVNYEYVLNTVHGGDYFKRWHRFMKNSGGMMIHKATHHFDIVNWLLMDDPISVSAHGGRLYFGNEEKSYADRCKDCDKKDSCTAYGDPPATLEFYNDLYFKNEKYDGYIRDHCAFKADTDIYDSMSVSVAYKGGAILTYSLNLFNVREGFTMNIIGENGRIEFSTFAADEDNVIRFRDGSTKPIKFGSTKGGHAGGDGRMLDMLFGNLSDDPLGQKADSLDGIKSILIGDAANRSIKNNGEKINLTKIWEKMP